ncbi:MAG: hypothetical protein KIT25_06710 [Enhydrobacter sp.]|nr:MAG: hypothetical protein KIT25_06710 [Enhydrobacter sp.]
MLLLLSGCDVLQSAQADLARLTSSRPAASPAKPSPKPATAPRTTQQGSTKSDVAIPPDPDGASATMAAATSTAAEATPIGRTEGEVRALFGPPHKEEDRSPGKTWHYRDGRCSMDIQFYPDVQTRQFGTLAYEVKSDDNTDEGKRGCLAQFRSRARSGSGG